MGGGGGGFCFVLFCFVFVFLVWFFLGGVWRGFFIYIQTMICVNDETLKAMRNITFVRYIIIYNSFQFVWSEM